MTPLSQNLSPISSTGLGFMDETAGIWDIVRLFVGSTLSAILAMFLVRSVHGSRFISIMVALSVGNLWYLVRYAWLSPSHRWTNLERRFAPVNPRVLLGCLAAGVAYVVVSTGLEEVLTWNAVKLEELPTPPFALSHVSQLPAAVIVMAIVGPLGEELLFRGLLLDWFRRKMQTGGAVFTVSLIFALAHGIAFRSGLAGWLQFGFRVVMGIVAALLTVRYRSLRPSFAFHATINLIVVIAMGIDTTGSP